jgi:hypothetical protein
MPRIILNTECLLKNDIQSIIACASFKEPLLDLFTHNGWSFTIISETLSTVYYKHNDCITSDIIPAEFLKFPCSSFKSAAECEANLNRAMHKVLTIAFNNTHIPKVISVMPVNDCTVIQIVHVRSDGSPMTTEFSVRFLEERL